ncbi:Intraflagellar transport protein 74 [Desmophyllum pertusum]|uniref:Intraflagellar transport protein 74 n=1 Tax=Desmophyllum pertusum TaxID=174260 RepID=A0A9X0CLZ8_9CNID|nr:Intraflagellar transport protein 74 [Desmophyllum pertusum]
MGYVDNANEHTRLQMDLEKVEQLETKITSELESLKERIETMTQELETYSDLDTLREQSEEKKTLCNIFCSIFSVLYEEKKALSSRKETFKKHVQRLSSLYDATKSKLMENETHSQLGNLERKWQHHEQNNFVMKEFIASKSMESDYRPLKLNVSEQLEDINRLLIQSSWKITSHLSLPYLFVILQITR